MATFTFATNPATDIDYSDASTDVFDATATTFRAFKRTTRAYPIDIRASASSYTFNGGTFLCDILATDGRLDIYKKTSNWNSALCFARAGAATFNGCVFGIQNNLNVNGIDAFRFNGTTGNVSVLNVRCWGVRDDFIEFDDSSGSLLVQDTYAENVYTGLSAKGATNARTFTLRRYMQHHRSWLEDQSTPSRLTHGHPFKTDSCRIVCDDFHLAVAPSWEETGYNRTFTALNNTTVQSGGATLYVLGGSHENRSLITAFQNRGYTVLEDGGGSSATNAWNAQKATFLATSPPPEEPEPPAVVTLGPSVTFNVDVP